MATPIATPAPADDAPVAAGGVREVARLAYPIVLTQMSQTVMHVVDSIFVGRLGAAELGALGFAGDLALDRLQRLQRHRDRRTDLRVAGATARATSAPAARWAWQGLYAVVPAAALAVFALRRASPSRSGRCSAPRPRSASTPSPTCACGRSGFVGPRDLDGARRLLPRHRRHAHAARRDARRERRERACSPTGSCSAASGCRPGASPAPASRRRSPSGWAPRCSPACFARRARARAATGRGRCAPDRAAIRRFLRTGAPIGGQWLLDMSAFALFTTLVARMGNASMAATQAMISLLSISFMQAIGIGLAATTLVGRYKGADDLAAARAQLPLGAEARAAASRPAIAALFLLAPEALMRMYIDDAEVLAPRPPAARARRRVPALRRAPDRRRAARCAAPATRAGRSSCRRCSPGCCGCRSRGSSRSTLERRRGRRLVRGVRVHPHPRRGPHLPLPERCLEGRADLSARGSCRRGGS